MLLLLLQVAAEAYVERVQGKHVQQLLRLAWCRWRLDAAAGRVRYALGFACVVVCFDNTYKTSRRASATGIGSCSCCCRWPSVG
jgi:hypothetical protein